MKRMFWVCLLVLGVMLNWSMVFAADVYVESSGSCGGKTPCYSTIQAAINGANSGDTIKLAQGIYAETFVLDSDSQFILQGGWDLGFTSQAPRTTAIRAPMVTKGAIAFQELRIMEIAGPVGDATIADVLDGKTFSSDAGTGLTGVMPNRGAVNYTPTTTDQTIAVGYYNGSGKVEGDADLVQGNIRIGVTLFGVTGKCHRLPLTGQTTGYASGDDGDYQWGCLPGVAPCSGFWGCNFDRTHLPWSSSSGHGFTDNGNGTVTDILTGLVWLKNAYCFGQRTWADALSDCNTLESGSCDLTDGSTAGDWRLPNINELRSLIDPDEIFPVLPVGHPFTGVRETLYWSSSTYAIGPSRAWGLNMELGQVSEEDKSSSANVWPVRSGN